MHSIFCLLYLCEWLPIVVTCIPYPVSWCCTKKSIVILQVTSLLALIHNKTSIHNKFQISIQVILCTSLFYKHLYQTIKHKQVIKFFFYLNSHARCSLYVYIMSPSFEDSHDHTLLIQLTHALIRLCELNLDLCTYFSGH